jgi:lipid-binding SYLF domain-containing protein
MDRAAMAQVRNKSSARLSSIKAALLHAHILGEPGKYIRSQRQHTRRPIVNMHTRTTRAVLSAIQVVALAVSANAALAQTSTTKQSSGSADSGAATSAIKHVDDAAEVVSRMHSEPGVDKLLQQSKGLYLVPTYGRAALGLGAAGGAGVFVAKRADGTWSNPAFFNIGGVSIGLQAGAEGGPVAIILMNDKAVNNFRQKNNFNLSADAGLTVVNWNRQASGTAGNGDVVVWSGAKGLFGNVATLALNDIRFNQKATQAFYGKPTNVQDVLEGHASNPHADTLKQALAASAGSKR